MQSSNWTSAHPWSSTGDTPPGTGMCRRNACAGIPLPVGGLRRKAQRSTGSCLIKALTGPDYMSEPGGGVRVSFLRWRKSIWWERGGAVPGGVSFCMNANNTPCRGTPPPFSLSPPPPASSTPNKHPHPSRWPDHTRASRRHKNTLSINQFCSPSVCSLTQNVSVTLFENALE